MSGANKDSGHTYQLGPFELIEPIGDGGMGVVWGGIHSVRGVPVAVKVIDRELAEDPRFRGAFHNEVRAVARLSHSAIVEVYDYGLIPQALDDESGGELETNSPYLVMERLSGGSLLDQPPPTRWRELRARLVTVLKALAYTHAQGILHRDLNPTNILFGGPSDLRPGLRLIDFGLASLKFDEGGPRSMFGGTPGYLAPEQIRRRHGMPEGPWTDLYAVGCLAFWLASGHGPFDDAETILDALELPFRDSFPKLEPRLDVPDGFEEWILQMTRTEPSRRMGHAADAGKALLALDASPEHLVVPSWKRSEHSRPMRLPGTGLGLYRVKRPPLVGRDEMCSTLWQTLTEVVETGSTRFVTLHGAAGAGKSRLAEWVCHRAAEVGLADWVRAIHGPLTASGEGLAKMLARHLDCDELDRQEVVRRMERFLRSHGVADTYAWYALAELLVNVSGSPDRDEGARSFGSNRRRLTVIADVLGYLARSRPLIVWLDDSHWDADALELVSLMLARHESVAAPVLLMATIRDDALAERPDERSLYDTLLADPRATTIDISPLSDDEMQELLIALLGLGPSLSDEVVKRADGNPLFAVELVGDWIRRDVVQPGRDGFELSEGTTTLVPDSLHAVWRERVERFTESIEEHWELSSDGWTSTDAVSAALAVAAAMGREIEVQEWEAACDVLGFRPPQMLIERMTEDALVVREGSTFTLAHSMLRESLERSARESGQWPRYHAACAAMLDVYYDTERGTVAERFGRHLFEANRLTAALEPLRVAAEFRLGRDEVDDAQRAVDLIDTTLDLLGTGYSNGAFTQRITELRGRMREKQASRPSKTHTYELRPIGPLEILLVEDNPGDVKLTEIMLEDVGLEHTLHAVPSGERGLEFLRRTGDYTEVPRPDLIFLDLRLPRIQGHEVLAEIRADEALRTLPVVVLTSSDAEFDVLGTNNLHADMYLTKPLSPDAIEGVLRSFDMMQSE